MFIQNSSTSPSFEMCIVQVVYVCNMLSYDTASPIYVFVCNVNYIHSDPS